MTTHVIPLLCLQVFTATSWTYPIYETYFTPLFCLHGFAGEIHRTIPWFFCWLNHLRFGPIQHSVSASSPPDRLMSAPWIDGKKHVARKLSMEPENDDFWKNGYIQGSIWGYICHTYMIYYIYISFYGVCFPVPCHFFWRVGCVGGYICFTRRYGMPKDPKFLPRNGIICACDTLRILCHLLRLVYQAFGSRSDTPCFTFWKQKVILRDFHFTTIPSLSNMKEEWYYWLLMQGTRQAFKNQSETTFDTTNPDSCIIIL